MSSARRVCESRKRPSASIESLEQRFLLAFISWENRGADNFEIYGASANIARGIVDRAIWDWQRAIVNFNYAGGGNTYNLDVRAAPLAGRGVTQDITHDAQRKPTSADITLDDNGAGGGWYFDPYVGSEYGPDDSEYTTIRGPFSADASASGNDFYRTILHEIGHALGLGLGNNLKINDYLADSGIDDPNDTGTATIRWIDFGFGEVGTMTEAGGGHLYEGPTLPNVNVVHPDDLMNDGRTVPTVLNRRQLINDKHVDILARAYGYSVATPSQINTFYVNLDRTNLVTTVRGFNGTFNDHVNVQYSHPFIVYEVNGYREQLYSHHSQTVRVETGEGSDTILLYSAPTQFAAEINSGGGDDIVYVGNGDVDSQIFSNVTVNGGGGGNDLLRVHDHVENNPSSDHYRLNARPGDPAGGVITKDSWTGVTCSYTAFERMFLYASEQGGNVHINFVPSIMTLSVFDGGGFTKFLVGNGDYDSNILGNLSISGGGGTDTIEIHDENDTGNDTYTVTATTFRKSSGGGTTTFDSTVEYLVVIGSDASTLYVVSASNPAMSYYIEAGGGNDQLIAGAGSMDDIRGLVNFNGGAGSDSVQFADDGDSGNDGYWFSADAMNRGDIADVAWQGIEAMSLRATTGNNNIQISGTPAGVALSIFANAGTDSIQITGASATGPVTIEPSVGDDSVSVVGAGAAVRFAATQRIGALTVNGGLAQLAAAGSMVLTATSATVTNGGRLDLTDEDMIIDYTGSSPIAGVHQLVNSGYAGGAWNGSGIMSSTSASTANRAVGFAQSSEIFTTFPATFSGQSVDNTAVLLKYTAYGDADLSGTVNLTDFNRLAGNFGTVARRWVHGNFDFDNDVDLSDFNRLASHFGVSGLRSGFHADPISISREVLT